MPDVAAPLRERPNSFSVGWSRGVEDVPTYEEAPNDPHAVAYRIARSLSDDAHELHCDTLREHFSIRTMQATTKLKKGVEQTVEISRYGSEETPASSFAQISGVMRKKLNLRQKEPSIKLNSVHGDLPMRLFRGGYCGFKHPENGTEYYWQLRFYDKTFGERGAPRFKDAVLRKAERNQLSSMVGMYVPHQSRSAGIPLDGQNSEMPPETIEERDMGRVLLRNDLDEFDKDMTLISFVAVLLRVIEAEKKDNFAAGFINALTVGET